MTDDVAEMLEKFRITEVLHRYCRGIDRLDRDLLRSVYHPDAQDEHGVFSGPAYEFIDFVLPLLRRMGATSHTVSNCLIELDGDSACAESYVTAFHADVPQENNPAIDVIAGARYVDRFEKRDGEWRILHRQCVVDWNQNLPASARWDGPMHGTWMRGARDGSDDSYGVSAFCGKPAGPEGC